MPYVKNDESPPHNWPSDISYLHRSRLSSTFPAELIPLLFDSPSRPVIHSVGRYVPRAARHPVHLSVRTINDAKHPAHGQAGLFTKKKIAPGEMIIPYFGVIHATLVSADLATTGSTPDDSVSNEAADQVSDCDGTGQQHEHSDYDLSLVRVSAFDPSNPFPGYHVSIGVDAATAGNAARFVNDYRGIAGEPNAEFRMGTGETGEKRMEIWAMKKGVGKGEEILVSYGKSWWSARR